MYLGSDISEFGQSDEFRRVPDAHGETGDRLNECELRNVKFDLCFPVASQHGCDAAQSS